MTLRNSLAMCGAFYEFEDLTNMHLSEIELEAYKEQADAAGVSMCVYFEQGVVRLKRALGQQQGQRRGMLH